MESGNYVHFYGGDTRGLNMSILIEGMEIPKVGYLLLVFPSGRVVEVFAETQNVGREAKAVSVPPHGDLIERDKLRAKEFIHDGDAYAVVMSRDIRNAPIIIPASEE